MDSAIKDNAEDEREDLGSIEAGDEENVDIMSKSTSNASIG